MINVKKQIIIYLLVLIPKILYKGQKLMDAVRIGTIPISPRYFKFPSNMNNKLKSTSPKMTLIILSILPMFFITSNLLYFVRNSITNKEKRFCDEVTFVNSIYKHLSLLKYDYLPQSFLNAFEIIPR